MQTDRTTKLLLLAIAAGLWALVLKPVAAPVPAVAQPAPAQPAATDVNIVGVAGLRLLPPARKISTWGVPVQITNPQDVR